MKSNNRILSLILVDLMYLLAVVVAGILAFSITSHLPEIPAAWVSALLIILISTQNYLWRSHPLIWWCGLGAIAGALGGTALILVDTAQLLETNTIPETIATRFQIILSLNLAGLIGGIILGRDHHDLSLPRPKVFIASVSALTTVAYTVLISMKFIVEGLDAARTLSSRLSTSTTILVAALAIPGWIGFRLGYHRFKK
jgi:hypothetical protein